MTPFITITLMSLGLSLAITIIYRILMNPDEVRKLKGDMKFYKEKMNEAKKAGDTAKMNDYASEMLKASQKQFGMSMKPMMATMLLFFMLLGWLNTSFGGVTADFSGGGPAYFTYNGDNHSMAYQGGADGFVVSVDFNDDGRFSPDETFSQDEVFEREGVFWKPVQKTEGFFLFAQPKEDAVQFDMFIAQAPFSIPFIGDYLTWFWWYVLLSLPATFALRKVMGVE